MSSLYVIATPIGNLDDISKRVLETLKKVDVVLAEDSRVIKKILNRFEIDKPVLSYHQHSNEEKHKKIKDFLKEGKNLGLVSDAGTPGVSDPGGKLVKEVSSMENVKIIPIPGPSSLTAAASISGFPMERFVFLGFPPKKRKRKKFFKEVLSKDYPVIFFESPYRIIKTLKELKDVFQEENKKADLVVCRELSKLYESIYRGGFEEVLREIQEDKVKGEFTVVLRKL